MCRRPLTAASQACMGVACHKKRLPMREAACTREAPRGTRHEGFRGEGRRGASGREGGMERGRELGIEAARP